MDLVIIAIGLRQAFTIEEEILKAISRRDLEDFIHLDRIERTNLDADLAAHADGSIDAKDGGVELEFAGGVRFLVLALLDDDALRRAFFFADLASDAPERTHGIGRILGDEKREVAIIFWQDRLLLWVLYRHHALRIVVAPGEVFRRDDETIDDAGAEHG